MKNRTSFVIAHRLSTVRRADAIIVLERGRVVEVGRHDELLARPSGVYARLYELQMFDERRGGRSRGAVAPAAPAGRRRAARRPRACHDQVDDRVCRATHEDERRDDQRHGQDA